MLVPQTAGKTPKDAKPIQRGFEENDPDDKKHEPNHKGATDDPNSDYFAARKVMTVALVPLANRVDNLACAHGTASQCKIIKA